VQYATYLGGSGQDVAEAIAADSNSNAYIAGETSSPDFPRKYAFQYSSGGYSVGSVDCFFYAFVAKIAPQGNGPSIRLGAITNAASYGIALAPAEIVSIFGSALAVTPATASGPSLPVQLSDVRVTVNGTSAPLFYVSPLQVNAQIPFETSIGPAQFRSGHGCAERAGSSRGSWYFHAELAGQRSRGH
jgi:hypothetical protein